MTEDRRPLKTTMTKREWGPVAGELGLSGREAEVSWYLLNGLTEGEIGEELDLSPHTVHSYVQRIYERTETRSHLDLTNRVFDEFRFQTETGYRRKNSFQS